LRSQAQLKTIPRTFHVDLPNDLVDEILADPKHVQVVGQRWAEMQLRDLLEKGFNNIHFYVMQDAGVVSNIVQSVV
jgi:methylenetetrahydrofolate reductase (NADPH)